MTRLSLYGDRFGRLLVIARGPNDKRGSTVWICKCDCGSQKSVLGVLLKHGITKSCGCIRVERISALRRSHMLTETALYRCWRNMKTRCLNSRSPRYGYYGGRGITICQRWIDSFADFVKDMGQPPTPQHQIERINNDGNYSPENCKWATRIEQANNKRPKGSAKP